MQDMYGGCRRLSTEDQVNMSGVRLGKNTAVFGVITKPNSKLDCQDSRVCVLAVALHDFNLKIP